MHNELRHKVRKYIATLEKCEDLLGTGEGLNVASVVADLRKMLEPLKLDTTSVLLCRLCKSKHYRSVFRFRRLLSRRWGLSMACVDLCDVTSALAGIIEGSGNPLNTQQLVHDLCPSQDWRFLDHGMEERYDHRAAEAYRLRLLDRLVHHIRYMDVAHLPGFVDPLCWRRIKAEDDV
ncbi:MAG: hypothetical protein E6R03_06495 [Hyphomicrobiaceae bacterium]|nr:MAG: hypothetical protein E6R03_06495 [Hyphomicrobiaceae bacterium]